MDCRFVLVVLLGLLSSGSARAANSPPSDPRDELVLRACGPGDSILHDMARRVAARALEDKTPLSMVELAQQLRARGESHPNPRAWTLKAGSIDRRHAITRLTTWLRPFRDNAPLRCGVASVQDSEKGEVLAVVMVPVVADLRVPIPLHLDQSRWVTVDVQVKQWAEGAKVVVLGPRGAPRTIPTSFDPATGRIVGRFMADREGRFLVQVLANLASGPRPVIESQLQVGKANDKKGKRVPGESAGHGLSDTDALFAKLNEARRREGLNPLQRDPVLDQLADDHALAMMKKGIVAHDTGQGSPPNRIANAGISSSEVGENVSRASNPTMAHRALWDSPSHRANMLHPRYRYVGVAAHRDGHGRVWVVQVFVGREHRE